MLVKQNVVSLKTNLKLRKLCPFIMWKLVNMDKLNIG